MTTRPVLKASLLGALVALCWQAAAFGLLIQPNYDDFKDTDLAVLKEAVKEWSDLLPCSDGKEVPINFVCDKNLSSLGLAEVWFNADGSVNHARVTLDNDGLYWTLADPSTWDEAHNASYDALTVAKHEVGHAIGFIHGGDFLNKVTVIDGTNRIYDMNNNGKFDDNDFDLKDGSGWDGHAASSTDLMYYQVPSKTRRHPTLQQAQVLGDAYGYCVIPEPWSLTIWSVLAGLGIALIYRRQRPSVR